MIANWKSVLGVDFCSLARDFSNLLSKFPHIKLVLCPSFLHVKDVSSIVEGSCSIKVGVQDVSQFSEDAYTGEIPAKYFSSMGIDYAIVGHAERRKNHQETNQIIKKKFDQVVQEGVVPIVCIGDEDPNTAMEEKLRFLEIQLGESISCEEDGRFFFVAYEPIYAIGGSQISVEVIEKVSVHIKQYISKKKYFSSIPVLYGGGVDSFVEMYSLWKRGIVDGVLLGRASLKADNLVRMLKEGGFI